MNIYINSCLKLKKQIKIYQNHESLWKSIKAIENKWKSMKINNDKLKSMQINDNQWKS